MLTSILSAICALAFSGRVTTCQADTTDIYIINGDKTVNFDGSQLVGKTVSDYKIMTASSTSNGVVSVSKIHMIRTDGKQAATVTSHTTTVSDENGEVMKMTIIGSDADSESNVTVMPGADGIEVFIDGKKSSREKMGKIKPEKISSMVVYRAGSKEARKWTKNNVNVIVVDLKK